MLEKTSTITYRIFILKTVEDFKTTLFHGGINMQNPDFKTDDYARYFICIPSKTAADSEEYCLKPYEIVDIIFPDNGMPMLFLEELPEEENDE